jgi:hypothetical protein
MKPGDFRVGNRFEDLRIRRPDDPVRCHRHIVCGADQLTIRHHLRAAIEPRLTPGPATAVPPNFMPIMKPAQYLTPHDVDPVTASLADSPAGTRSHAIACGAAKPMQQAPLRPTHGFARCMASDARMPGRRNPAAAQASFCPVTLTPGGSPDHSDQGNCAEKENAPVLLPP